MRKLFVLAILCFGFSISAAAQQPIRVRCGGPSYTDSSKQVWQADYGYTGGSASSTSAQVGGTADQTLFQSARTNGNNGTPLSYSFTVPNGTYQVNLLFAETAGTHEAIGSRVFNVEINGNMAFQNLDIFAAAGARAALVKSTDATVQNGKLQLQFANVVSDAKIDAIEIVPIPAFSSALNLNFTYPDGTPVTGTLSYTISSSLLSYHGSTALANGKAQCALMSSPLALGISAQFQLALSLSDSSGNTLWQVNLVLNPADVNLALVQSSSLNVIVNRS